MEQSVPITKLAIRHYLVDKASVYVKEEVNNRIQEVQSMIIRYS